MVLLARQIVLIALSVAVSSPSPAAAQTPYAADRLVDSVGVNIHLHYAGSLYYENFPLIQSRLQELGVRHVRDGLIDTTWQPYFDRHNALGRAGIKGLFIVSPEQSVSLLQQYPSRMSSTFTGYEGPNEYNDSGDPNWIQTLRATLTRLRGLRDNPALAAYPVYGPSLTKEPAYAALGDVSSLIDYGNLHNYMGGRHPGTPGWGSNGYGSIDWNLRLVAHLSRDKPTITTETGYWDDPALQDSVPQEVAGKYMPRMLLEHFRKGIVRTYIYELCDFSLPQRNLTSSYGMLNRDGSPKPSFNAVKGLLNLMSDPGLAFPLRSLNYSVANASADVRHMMFQKRDRSYYLAIWIEQPAYDVNTKRMLAVPPQSVTVTVPDSVRMVNAHRWQADGSVLRSATPNSASTFTATITDALTVLELRPLTAPRRHPMNVRLIP